LTTTYNSTLERQFTVGHVNKVLVLKDQQLGRQNRFIKWHL
jgi:hypothetical protein